MKKRCFILFSIFFVILLSACSKKTAGDENKDVIVEAEGNRIVADLAENLVIDAKVRAPQKDTYPVYLADQYDPEAPNMEEVIKKLFQSEVSELDIMTDGDAFSATMQGLEGGIINPYKKVYSYRRYDIETPYEHLFYLSPPSPVPYQYIEEWGGEWQEELDSLKKDDAIKIVHDLGNNLNLGLAEEPEVCWAFDQTALEELACYEKNYFYTTGMQYEWKEEDSCYYMIWNMQIDDERIASSNFNEVYNTHSRESQGSYLGVIIAENGDIVWLSCQFGYHVTDTKTEENITIQPEDVSGLVSDYYDNKILENKRIVTEIMFCYIPKQIQSSPLKYEMIPGYQVVICAEGKDLFDTHEIIYFDAITGKIV